MTKITTSKERIEPRIKAVCKKGPNAKCLANLFIVTIGPIYPHGKGF